ncbi:sugar transporter [Dionaea muscipula]
MVVVGGWFIGSVVVMVMPIRDVGHWPTADRASQPAGGYTCSQRKEKEAGGLEPLPVLGWPATGLAIGVVNLAIVVPLLVIPLGAGPWNALFGGGNIPPFALASLCAFAAGIITTHRLPHLWGSSFEVVLCACIVSLGRLSLVIVVLCPEDIMIVVLCHIFSIFCVGHNVKNYFLKIIHGSDLLSFIDFFTLNVFFL